jgi:hypothetical protein
MMLRFGAALCAAVLSTLLASPTYASTSDGKFAVKGGGLASCAAFVEARKARSDAYSRFIGWVEGYVSAANRYEADTFDLAPYETAEIYGTIIGGHCAKNPEDHVFAVVQKLVVSLSKDRLRAPSDMLRVRGKDKVHVVAVEVVRRAQTALRKQNLYRGEITGAYDKPTQDSIGNFQAAVGVPVTGMPDPLTLWLLFSS